MNVNDIIRIVNKAIASLREICDNLIVWKNQDIFKNMEGIVGEINQVFTTILMEKNKLKEYDVVVNDNEIIEVLGNMLSSMENKDVVLLLDTLEGEMLVILEDIENKLKM